MPDTLEVPAAALSADLFGPCGPVDRPTLDAVDAAVARVLGEGADLGDGQRETVLGALVDDCFAVLPPAAGKTAVYAVTGLVLGGPTVVVSPTLSLHRDQVATSSTPASAPTC